MARDGTAGRWWPPVRRALATAVTTMLAIILTIASVVPLAPAVGPVVMGAMLALTLSRSQLERDARGRLEAAVALPAVGLMAAGVGALLLDARIVGAAVFVLGMTASIWLYRFGPVARRLGGLLALPFVALLVAPAPIPTHPTGPLAAVPWLIPIVVALIAFSWVTLVQLGSRAVGLLPRRARAWQRPSPPVPTGGDAPPWWRPRPTDRLALQMGLALALAFAVGFVFFSDRWAWIVLTVLVVTIGNAGRADVLYKGIQRVVGAAIGTLLALLPAVHLGPPSLGTIALLVAIVFVGLVAREFAYIWWALFFTLALVIIQGFAGGADGRGDGFLLGERLEEILIGSALTLLVAWFVLPVRSEGTVRRCLGTVLAALDARMAVQDDDTAHELRAALADLARVSKPYDAWRRVVRHGRRPRAAGWIATVRDCVDLADGGAGPEARRLLGAARRRLRDPDELQPALDLLKERLTADG